jgi:hypothetical protein
MQQCHVTVPTMFSLFSKTAVWFGAYNVSYTMYKADKQPLATMEHLSHRLYHFYLPEINTIEPITPSQ